MAQILGGLITYLLLAMYCHEQHQEKVSISRVRELRIKIHNEIVHLVSANDEGEESDAPAGQGPPSHASS